MQDKADKGQRGGSCNRSACQAPGAIFYNHGSQSYYCHKCAADLSLDRFNRADAERLYGHALCTIPADRSFGHHVSAMQRRILGAILDDDLFNMRYEEFKERDRAWYHGDRNEKELHWLIVEYEYIRFYADAHGHAILKPYIWLAHATISVSVVNAS
jgi:hypothetical protein